MADFDLDAPATLHWVTREVPRERRLNSVKDAVRIAMTELKRGEFFSAKVACVDHVFSGDEIRNLPDGQLECPRIRAVLTRRCQPEQRQQLDRSQDEAGS